MFDAYVPQNDGLLPYYLLYCGISALAHSAVTYLNPIASLRQFSGPSAPAPNPLTAHVYGVKNVYTGLIRLYAAYHIGNPQLYTLAQWTFVGVLVLYVGELAIWKTVRMKEGAIPLVTAGLGILWMTIQRDWYLS
ncbi:hypothetical protein V495_03457 [Pseudogymnoascus sp. VKM F-4514 (FW-929)]|nr:hypothetical protein V490_02981 [Pseudogymnoascus sp. VKM F-3557]KFY44420.1 hypothetical protein V495_03457 [Pseudogymnoascus sp. VKM F-4514 (FW-929)]KFY58506.1 hypothetical protein V497_04806 [Pseudogymnoascus sp. VKM F-4516 (FW-969)]